MSVISAAHLSFPLGKFYSKIITRQICFLGKTFRACHCFFLCYEAFELNVLIDTSN